MTAITALALATGCALVASGLNSARLRILESRYAALENSHRHECNALRRDVAQCRRNLADAQEVLESATQAIAAEFQPSDVITLTLKEVPYEH